MDELAYAGISAIELFQEVDHQGKGAAAVVLMQQNGMRNVAAFHHLGKGRYNFRITKNFHQL